MPPEERDAASLFDMQNAAQQMVGFSYSFT